MTVTEAQGPPAISFPRTPLHERRPLAVDLRGAAQLLGCSEKFFRRAVLPEIKVIVRGEGKRRRYLIPIRELERWLDESSRQLFDEELPAT